MANIARNYLISLTITFGILCLSGCVETAFLCEKNLSPKEDTYSGDVCGLIENTIYCVKAPCPQFIPDERITFKSPSQACALASVDAYSHGSCTLFNKLPRMVKYGPNEIIKFTGT